MVLLLTRMEIRFWKYGLRHGKYGRHYYLIAKGKILYSNDDTYEGKFNCGHMEGEVYTNIMANGRLHW